MSFIYVLLWREKALLKISPLFIPVVKKGMCRCTFPERQLGFFFSLRRISLFFFSRFCRRRVRGLVASRSAMMFRPKKNASFLERGRRRQAKRQLRIGGSSSSSRFFDRNSLFCSPPIRHPIDAMMSFFYTLDASRRRSLADETHERIRHHVLR